MQKVLFLLQVARRLAQTAIGFSLLLSISNVSCEKKKCVASIAACPAFSDTFFDSWFPYRVGQEVIFRSTAGREKKMVIQEQYKSLDKAASTFEYDCNNHATVSPVPISEQCPNARIQSTQPTNNTVWFRVAYSPSRELVLYIDTTWLYASSLQDTGIVNLQGIGRSRFASSRFYPAYNANGTSYNNVQVISRDTLADRSSGIYRLVLAKTLGLVEYEEYPSHILWRKQ